MFEDVSPFLHGDSAGKRLSTGENASVESVNIRRGGGALRAIGWTELSARLNAARELREILREEASQNAFMVASFGDAASSYFSPAVADQPDINSVDLEHSKASSFISFGKDELAGKGEREKKDD